MNRRLVGRLHDQIHTRAELSFTGEFIDPVKTEAGVKSQTWEDPPFVLEVNAIKLAGPRAIIDDINWHNRSLGARRVDRQNRRRGVERCCLNLSEESAAQSVAVIDPPSGVSLHSLREIGFPCERAHAIEQKIADHVRAERQNTVADKGRDLHLDILDMS